MTKRNHLNHSGSFHTIRRAKTSILQTSRHRYTLLLLGLFLFAIAGRATANVHSPQGALDIAAITPGKYAFAARGANVFDQAEITANSVSALLEMMKDATETAATLPKQNPATSAPALAGTPAPQAATLPAPVPTDADIALRVAAMVPQNIPPTTPDGPPRTATSRIAEPGKLLWPVEGFIYSTFHASRGRRGHGAIDICAGKGTPVAAAADGMVSIVSNNGKGFRGYGKIVILDHGNGMHTVYAHCDDILVKMGQRVKQGDFIATVGRTGRATTNLLHFEVRLTGKKQDPLKHLPSRPELVKMHNWQSSRKKAN